MRRESPKTRKRRQSCSKFRRELIQRVGHCEMCGHSPRSARTGDVAWSLCVHEIARGSHRQKALDAAYAVLVLCYLCHAEIHEGKERWTEARQLGLLRRSRPEDFDLEAYNRLIGLGPNRIAEEDVT